MVRRYDVSSSQSLMDCTDALSQVRQSPSSETTVSLRAACPAFSIHVSSKYCRALFRESDSWRMDVSVGLSDSARASACSRCCTQRSIAVGAVSKRAPSPAQWSCLSQDSVLSIYRDLLQCQEPFDEQYALLDQLKTGAGHRPPPFAQKTVDQSQDWT